MPKLGALPPGLVLDGELIAWNEGEPWFPDVCHRVLNRDGEDVMSTPFSERRAALERLDLNGHG